MSRSTRMPILLQSQTSLSSFDLEDHNTQTSNHSCFTDLDLDEIPCTQLVFNVQPTKEDIISNKSDKICPSLPILKQSQTSSSSLDLEDQNFGNSCFSSNISDILSTDEIPSTQLLFKMQPTEEDIILYTSGCRKLDKICDTSQAQLIKEQVISPSKNAPTGIKKTQKLLQEKHMTDDEALILKKLTSNRNCNSHIIDSIDLFQYESDLYSACAITLISNIKLIYVDCVYILHLKHLTISLQGIIWSQIYKLFITGIKKVDYKQIFMGYNGAIPQHTISVCFIWFEIYYNSLQLFTMDTLDEFSIGCIELDEILISKYIYNKPGVLVIIIWDLCFDNNICVEQITFKRRNYDLQQDGEFTVYYFIFIVVIIIISLYMIQFIINDFIGLSIFAKIMFICVRLLINLCEFLYCNKCVIEKKEIKQRNVIITQYKSTPLFDWNKCNKIKTYS